MKLIVTQDGMPLDYQKFGVRLFRDATSTKERYRIVWRGVAGWLTYHSGRPIFDPPNDSIASIMNYLAEVRKAK